MAVVQVAKAMAATDPGRAARLFTDAEQIGRSITDEPSKVSVLCHLAAALAATDPGRAARLLTDAEHIGRSITDESWKKESVLGVVAKAVAAADPGSAERIVGSIPSAAALGGIAEAMAATDPDRAERIAYSITPEHMKVMALHGIAEAMAATDPGRAARIARSITEDYSKDKALCHVAKALAATDPGLAERIARSIEMEYWQSAALSGVAETLAATDPDGAARLFTDAERIARSMDEFWKPRALRDLAEALAATDPEHAGTIVHSIPSETMDFLDRTALARALAPTDPDYAESIAHSITEENAKESALSGVAEALAATDPDRAEHIAHSITSVAPRSWALCDVAGAMAATDPDRAARLFTDAERIAQSITHQSVRSRALCRIAGALAAATSLGVRSFGGMATCVLRGGCGMRSVVRRSSTSEPVEERGQPVLELGRKLVWGCRGTRAVAVVRRGGIGLDLLLVERCEAGELSGGELLLAEGEGVGQELGVVLGLGSAGARLDGVQGAAEHVVVHDPPERQLRRRVQVKLVEGGEGLLDVAHGVWPELGLVERRDGPRVGEKDVSGSPGDDGDGLAPLRGQLVVGDQQVGEDRVLHQRHHVGLGADVVVEAHRARAEFGGDALHRDGLETVDVGDP